MILLASTTDKIQVITGTAITAVVVHASYIDNASGTITPGRENTSITTAATTDVVDPPAASTYRNVKTINIRNTSASSSTLVTVRHTDGTTAVDLFQTTLGPAETMTYVEGMGWDVFLNDGSHKAMGARTLIRILAADATGTLATTAQPWFPAGGAVSLRSDTLYNFEGFLYLTTGGTTHTTGLSFGGTAVISSIIYRYWFTSAAAAAIATASSESVVTSAANFVMAATSTAATTRVGVEHGTVRVTTGGTFIPNFTFSASPTGTTLVKAGSYFRIWAVGAAAAETLGTWT